jgi:PDZ domain-containing protein
VLAGVLGLLGATVRVPFVALGDGPTFDVLGTAQDGHPVIDISGPAPVYPTSGQLRMTTVAVTTQVTLFGAMAMWASGDEQVLPRESVYPPGRSSEQVDRENSRQFAQSESDAEAAALRYLGYPTAVQIGSVLDNSPSAGRLAPGDRIVAINGRPVNTPQEVLAALAPTRPGQTVIVTVQRGPLGAAGPPTDVPIVAAARPDGDPRGFLGVTPTNVVASPVDVHISLGDIGGPSAGLIFASAIVDKLTPGALTGGRIVAGTGTIDATGRVGDIGGIRFKMDAARHDGAQVFLVPAGNCAEAVGEAPPGLQLARVGTLAEGIAALQAVRDGRTPAPC